MSRAFALGEKASGFEADGIARFPWELAIPSTSESRSRRETTPATRIVLPFRWRPIMIEDLLQPRHLLVILAIALLFFGPQKLPELGKGIGQGIRSFKASLKDVSSDDTPTEPKA